MVNPNSDRWMRLPARLVAVLFGGAAICGAAGVTGAWDTAHAQARACGDRSIADKVLGRDCPPLSQREIAKRNRQRAADERAASRDLAEKIGESKKQLRPFRAKRVKRSDTAVGVIRGKKSVAGRKSVGRRGSDVGRRRAVGSRSARVKPLRRAFKHYRAERRDFRRAAVRFARTPRHGTFKGLRREFRQVRKAHRGFHRAAARFARRR